MNIICTKLLEINIKLKSLINLYNIIKLMFRFIYFEIIFYFHSKILLLSKNKLQIKIKIHMMLMILI